MSASITEPEWAPDDDPDAPPGFRARRAFVGRQAGARKLGASLWELPAGQSACPYHFHLLDEELLVVLRGSGRLRTPDGWRDLAEGEVVSFPVGEAGAHQVMAGPDGPLRLLLVSTAGTPEICVYPDSGKVLAAGRHVADVHHMSLLTDAVGYWQGESAPPPA